MGTRLNRLLVSVLFHFVGFEDVAQLDVAEALQRDAAVVAVLHFLHVVLEAAQGSNLIIGNDDAVTHKAHLARPRTILPEVT